jgi:uncharacterized membrane protein YphA (DoxX/SURF4 family)
MALAGLLLIIGLICLLFVSWIIGVILIVAAICVALFWAAPTFRGGYTGTRRYYW